MSDSPPIIAAPIESDHAPVASSPNPPAQRQFPCKHCGANLLFSPGAGELKCPYCGTINEIPDASTQPVQEQDYLAALQAEAGKQDLVEVLTVRCGKCGAEATLGDNITAGLCPFCGSPIVAEGLSKRLIKPKCLLPFHVTQAQAGDLFKTWISSRWFAPSELKRRAEQNKIAGVYVPYWTYDSQTSTEYTGQRGDDYWETETYTEYVNGQSVTRTRQVQRTRWSFASGRVEVPFDDILVLATQCLPPRYANKLEPWDLKDLVPYQDEYLSGFVAHSYQVDLPQGFEAAKAIMAPSIRRAICSDIGGDHQRIDSADTTYSDITFKHLLLPVWLSAYLYGGKIWHFLVNARTGEIQGERPYSALKITLTVISILIAILIIFLIIQGGR